MSAAKQPQLMWSNLAKIAGISVMVGMALAGCSKADKSEDAPEETVVVDNSDVAPAVGCQDPLVQDRLKNALKNALYQQSQSLVVGYGSEADVSLDTSMVRNKINNIGVGINNISMLQAANANGITTCQAAISLALPSEDVFLTNQLNAENNHPTLQSQVAQDNLRMSDNTMIDDALTYIVGAQNGQVQVRIVSNPPLLTAAADVVASSMLKSALDNQSQSLPQSSSNQGSAPVVRAPRPAAPAQPKPPAQPTAPAKPAQPSKPAESLSSSSSSNSQSSSSAQTPSSSSSSSSSNNSSASSSANSSASAPSTSAKPQPAAPKDDSIDMVIIEENGTY